MVSSLLSSTSPILCSTSKGFSVSLHSGRNNLCKKKQINKGSWSVQFQKISMDTPTTGGIGIFLGGLEDQKIQRNVSFTGISREVEGWWGGTPSTGDE